MASELEIQASSYITKCEEAVNNGDRAAARQLTEVIVNLYSKCIRGLTSGLTEYSHFDVTDYIKDIKTLKKKLETYQEEFQKKAAGQETSKDPILHSIPTNAGAEGKDMGELLAKAKEVINGMNLPNSEQIKEALAWLDTIKQTADSGKMKQEKWLQLKGCIAWLSESEADLGLVILPLVSKVLEK